MVRSLVPALTLLVFCAGPLLVRAEDAPKKPLGTWTRSAGDAEVTFAVKAERLKVTLKRGGATVEADVDYGVSKDGVLFGRVNKVTKTGTNDGPDEGDLFSFKFTVVDGKMTVEELKGKSDSAEAKQLIEGEYKKS